MAQIYAGNSRIKDKIKRKGITYSKAEQMERPPGTNFLWQAHFIGPLIKQVVNFQDCFLFHFPSFMFYPCIMNHICF